MKSLQNVLGEKMELLKDIDSLTADLKEMSPADPMYRVLWDKRVELKRKVMQPLDDKNQSR